MIQHKEAPGGAFFIVIKFFFQKCQFSRMNRCFQLSNRKRNKSWLTSKKILIKASIKNNIMKRNSTIIGLLLVILIAGNGCHNIRHESGDIKENGKTIRMRVGRMFRHNGAMPGMHGRMFQGMRPGMMGAMGPGMGMMRGMRPGMRNGMGGIRPGMGMGMRRGMGSMPGDSTGWMSMAPGRRMLESIPNVTENQKKQITELMTKHQDELKKLQEEMSSKMQSLMDSHKKDILNILTDEQKKYIESARGKSAANQKK